MTKKRFLVIVAVMGPVMISCGLLNMYPSTDISPTKPATEMPPDENAAVSPPLDEDLEIPDKPLSSEGPWWTFSTAEGLFAINPDGSGLTQFHFGPINPPYARQILAAPSGGYLAYLIGESFDATLNVFKLSGYSRVTEKPLLPSQSDPGMEAMRAIVEYQSFAFSPDGHSLAFMGAIDGPTSDLYLFSLDSFKTTRLTDGPSQGYQPVWSPDGRYIVHTGASSFGSGAGAALSGVWAAQADNSEVKALYDPSGSGSERILGWVDDQTFLVYSWDMSCGSNNLRTFNIETKESSQLWAESFRSIAYDQADGVALLSSKDGECGPHDGAGIYLVPTDGNVPYRIIAETPPQVVWSPEAKLFLASGDFESWALAIDSTGQYIDLDMPQGARIFPAVAPGSKDLAWRGESLWVGPLRGSIDNPPQEIFDDPVDTVTWAPDGQSVIFFADSGLYIAHRPDYTPILIGAGLDNRDGYSGWVMP